MNDVKSNSLIINFIITVFLKIIKVIKDSKFATIFVLVGRFFDRLCDSSIIVNFLSGDVDEFTGIRNRGFLYKNRRRVNCISKKLIKSNGKFAKAIKSSFILGIFDENILMILYMFLVFGLPFLPTVFLAALSLFICCVYILNVLLGKVKTSKPSVVGAFTFLFSIMYMISSIISYNRSKGILIAMIIISFIAVSYSMISFIDNKRKLHIIINTMLISGFLVALYGIFQYFTGIQTDASWVDASEFSDMTTRVYSVFDNPNVLGEYLIIIASIGFGMFWKEKRKSLKFIYFIFVVVSAICLAFTGSRGSMIGLIVALVVFVLVSEKKFILLGILALFAMPLFLPASIVQRLSSAIAMNDSSSLYRKSIYDACLNMYNDFAITGIGVGSFDVIYPLYSLNAAYALHAHNIFLQIGLETGILGLFLFLSTIFFYLQKMYAGARKTKNGYRYLITMILGGFAGLLVQGLVDNIWYDYSICMVFWLTIAVGIAAVNMGCGYGKN